MTDAYVVELEERLAQLEWMLESPEWRLLTAGAEQEFTRSGLHAITELSRVMFLKNPVVKRGISVKRFYIWGQGWTVKAREPEIQQVLDWFLYDQKNDDVIGSHEARMQMEVELETDGNLFFCFFVNQVTGRVRVRRIDFGQIDDIICNPEDAKEPWYYKRTWAESTFNATTGTQAVQQRTAYYPDWRYDPMAKLDSIGGHPVHWDRPVYHVRIGGFSNWKFGISEIYDAIDWAAAYKSFLEDWASIVRAYRKFAFQLNTPGGSKAVAAAKARLNTASADGTVVNPPPIAGSTFIASEGVRLEPVRTSGATVSADDGRRLLLMVAASIGLPETFFGDASVGTLATAKSLDRPTELMMEDRQQLWRDVFLNIFNFVTLWAVRAPQGALRTFATVRDTPEDDQHNFWLEWQKEIDPAVSVEFPPLLQHDIPQMVAATVQAATLGASGTLAGTVDMPTLSRLLLVALGVPDADEIVERLFPDGEMPDASLEQTQTEALMVQAVKDLRDAILRESATGA